VLTVGGGDVQKKGGDITGVVDGMEGVDVEDARRSIKANAPNMTKGSKGWIVKKKEQMERKGKIVKATSKYTGRKRRIQF
jgi:18S rRNA (guanine1575-N7)-methyltransferase